MSRPDPLYALAERFVGEVVERPGAADEPFIQWCHASCGLSPDTPDAVPWCSSFLNRLAWLLRLPRSKSAAARSWLRVGTPIALEDAVQGDVVILRRGPAPQPGPEVTSGAAGHVTLWSSREGEILYGLGGNQGDGVSIGRYFVADVLGVRRLTR